MFALVGYVFNELMILKKLIFVSQPADNAHPFVAEAGMTSALAFLRLLAGKTHEAMDSFSKPATKDVLREKYFRPVAGLMERWDEAVRQYGRLGWLRFIRNQRALHYMTPGHRAYSEYLGWRPSIGGNDAENMSFVSRRSEALC